MSLSGGRVIRTGSADTRRGSRACPKGQAVCQSVAGAGHEPAAAFSSSEISIFFMLSIAATTRWAFSVSGSLINS